jgi:hypothetical protein
MMGEPSNVPGVQIVTDRADLVERLAVVLHSSRTIRSEIALAMRESSDLRVAARQLRIESLRTAEQSAPWRRDLAARKAERRRRIAQAIVQVLSSRGYSAFTAPRPENGVSIQQDFLVSGR